MRSPVIRCSLKQQNEAISIKLTTAHTHARTSGCISNDPVQSTLSGTCYIMSPPRTLERSLGIAHCCPHAISWLGTTPGHRAEYQLLWWGVSSDDTPLSCPSCSLSDPSGSVQGRLSRAQRRPPAHSTPADTGRPARPPDAGSSVDKAFPQRGSEGGALTRDAGVWGGCGECCPCLSPRPQNPSRTSPSMTCHFSPVASSTSPIPCPPHTSKLLTLSHCLVRGCVWAPPAPLTRQQQQELVKSANPQAYTRPAALEIWGQPP